MALPDPELELLRELLKDDPGNEVFMEVARELADRREWAEAADILAAALEEEPGETDGWRLLVRAAFESGRFQRALGALDHVDCDPSRDLEMARLQVMIFEESGQHDRARLAARAALEVAPGDPVIEASLERMLAPPPDRKRVTPDPLISVERAEAYASMGRIDRAIRVYRRLLHLYPSDRSLAGRLAELRNQPFEVEDDLSEELPRVDEAARASGGPPPELHMPSPNRGEDLPVPARSFFDDEEATDPGTDVEKIRREIEARQRDLLSDLEDGDEYLPVEGGFVYGQDDGGDDDEEGGVDGDDEPTNVITQAAGSTAADIEARIESAKAKKRRSLLGR